MPLKNLVGETFTRLTVISDSGERVPKARNVIWLCQCTCGNKRLINGNHLTTGNVKSCGCLSSEVSSKKATTHGMRGSLEYSTWQAMKSRCNNPKATSYAEYGGAGVIIHPSWLTSFETFFSDMGYRPHPSYSLDRIDTKGGYNPTNCRWASPTTQARNIRIPKRNKTGVIGVRYKPNRGRYEAFIGLNSTTLHLVTTKDFFEAVCARKSAENRLGYNT